MADINEETEQTIIFLTVINYSYWKSAMRMVANA